LKTNNQSIHKFLLNNLNNNLQQIIHFYDGRKNINIFHIIFWMDI